MTRQGPLLHRLAACFLLSCSALRCAQPARSAEAETETYSEVDVSGWADSYATALRNGAARDLIPNLAAASLTALSGQVSVTTLKVGSTAFTAVPSALTATQPLVEAFAEEFPSLRGYWRTIHFEPTAPISAKEFSDALATSKNVFNSVGQTTKQPALALANAQGVAKALLVSLVVRATRLDPSHGQVAASSGDATQLIAVLTAATAASYHSAAGTKIKPTVAASSSGVIGEGQRSP